MATAPLRIPVTVDGRSAIVSLEQIQAAARRAREEIADQVAGSARIQAQGTQAAAELERRRIALVLQGIEDETERRVASINLTSALEAQAVEKLVRQRLAAGEITKKQAGEIRAEFDRLGEAARKSQVGRVEGQLGGVARQGRNASEAVISLARGLEDASYANGNFAQIVRFSGNNVAQFVTQIGYAKAEAAAAGMTVRQSLVASLAGPAGLLLALAAVQVALPIVTGMLAEAGGEAAVTADEMSRAAQEAINLALETDNLTLSKAEEAEAYRDVLKAQVERIEQGLRRERAELNELITSTSGVERATGVLRAQQDGLNEAIRAGTRNLEYYRTELQRVEDELRLFELKKQAVDNLRTTKPGIGETDSERRAREQAEREAERERQRRANASRAEANREARRRQTEARQLARQQAREARQDAIERARLQQQLLVLSYEEGFDREKQQLFQQRNERLVIAGRDASLRLAVEAQYQRDLDALRTKTAQALLSRERANLDAVYQARSQAYDRLGRTDEEAAQADIERARQLADDEARVYGERYAVLERQAERFYSDEEERAAAVGRIRTERAAVEADLATVVREGTYAEAERLAVLAAEDEALRPLLGLLLARLDAEARVAARTRERRIEGARAAREEAARERERADELERARRITESGGAAPEPTGVQEAEARLRRARQALADVDDALARLLGTAGEVVEAEDGSVSVVVRGQRVVGDEAERLAEERKRLAEDVKDAEVEAATEAANEVRESYQDRLDAAEGYASAAVDAIEGELTRQRRFSDLQVRITQERYTAEEAALKESLRRREIDRKEYELRMKELRADRAEFEEAVLQDERNVIAAFLDETVNLFVAAAKEEVAATLAPYIAKYFEAASEWFSSFLGPFGPVAAAATVPAAIGVFRSVVPGLATGGEVEGPGGPTDDRVLARLSAGEHVLTAREVAAMGGHEAVRRLRERSLQGLLPRFATGGAVGSAPLFPPRPVPRVSSAAAEAATASVDLSPLAERLDALREVTAGLREDQARTARQLDRQLGEIERLKTSPAEVRIYPDQSAAVRDAAAVHDAGRQSSARPARAVITPRR